jgi:arylsulfatase A-like enzyme
MLIIGLALSTVTVPRPASAAGSRTPSLLLITIDTWRWDHIGASGSGRVETPALDRLAREGVYEREAVTPSPLTTPAHASILTGLDILHHGILNCTAYRLDDRTSTLAEGLRSKGLRTAAFVASETLKRRYGLDRGFDRYDDSGMATRGRGDWNSPSRDGSAVTEAVIAHLKTQGSSPPLFVWAHYYDLHLPYRPRPGLDELHPGDPYSAQAAFVDGQVAILRSALEADKGRSWRIVVVGDHGEGLGDRGEDTHGIGLYRSTLHVPLILWPRPTKPLRHPKPWGLVDLLPSVRDWFDLPASSEIDGESLFREGRKSRWLSAVSAEPTLLFGVAPFKGIRQERYFYLQDGGEELYDLSTDPDERTNLAGESAHRDILDSLRRVAHRAWPREWPSSAPAPSTTPNDEERRKLQSLGYLSGRSPSTGVLPHAPIGKLLLDRSLWERAREEDFRNGRRDATMALLERLVVDYPASAFLKGEYGMHLAQAGRLKEGIRQLEEALLADPRDIPDLTNLGALYLKDGRDAPAEASLKQALALDPANAKAHKNLGILYAEYRKEPAQAIPHYREYLRMEPDSPDAPVIRAYLEEHPDSGHR